MQRARSESRDHAWFESECRTTVCQIESVMQSELMAARTESTELQNGVLDLQSEVSQWKKYGGEDSARG